jgi:hypothetical protein
MTRPTDADRKRHRDLLELYALVPPDASLAMSEQEMPHVSRLNMRSLRDTVDADYFLYGISSQGGANGEQLLAGGQADKIAERPGLKLLRRKDLAPADPADLAARAHWRTSSAFGSYAPTGVGERWTGAGHVFFHTNEEPSPWIEFDLGAVVRLQSFAVFNRRDCCQDRAAPLVVEASADGASWIEVAKRTAAFDTWGEPLSASARYLRFRATRTTYLHFARVEIR